MKRAIVMGALVGAFAIVASASIAVAAKPTTVGGGSFEFENGRYGTIAVTAGPTAEDGGRVNLWVRKPDGELVFHFNGPVTRYKEIDASTAGACGEAKVLKGDEKIYFNLQVTDRGKPGADPGDSFNFIRRDTAFDNCPGAAAKQPERFMTGGNLKVRH